MWPRHSLSLSERCSVKTKCSHAHRWGLIETDTPARFTRSPPVGCELDRIHQIRSLLSRATHFHIRDVCRVPAKQLSRTYLLSSRKLREIDAINFLPCGSEMIGQEPIITIKEERSPSGPLSQAACVTLRAVPAVVGSVLSCHGRQAQRLQERELQPDWHNQLLSPPRK